MHLQLSEATRTRKQETALGFRSQFRRISDPRFDKPRTLAGGCDNLQGNSRFPKLVFGWKTAKKGHGVVNLNTACERKYRSWSDPIEYTQAKDIWSQTGTFNRDFNTTPAFLLPLGREMNETNINKEQLFFLSFSFSTTYTWTLKTAKAYRDQTMGIRTSFDDTLNLFIWRSYAFKSNVESSGAVKSSKFI